MKVEHIACRVQQKGYRLTKPRLAVLQVLAESGERLSPAAVHRRARAIYPRVGLVTVYRTLDMLAELGLTERVHLEDGCHTYVLAKEGHHHQLLCTHCGEVIYFEGDEDIVRLTRWVAQRTGYRIDDHRLELLGTCPGCQSQGRDDVER